MELKHIDIARLSVSALNMRGTKKSCDIANILPSVRARGVLVPLIVRERVAGEDRSGSEVGAGAGAGAGEGGGALPTYEILGGARRYHAALALAEEGAGIEDLPCAVLEAGDDAAALEASLIENIARLDPDEMTRCETFTRLVREGRGVEAIAQTFGLTALQVKRTLALGNLIPRLRQLYRQDKIDAVTLRHLTMASKTRQRDWVRLHDDKTAYAPVGSALKAWLFGGASIPVSSALFDVDAAKLEVIADLFGEDAYFADAEAFWAAQMAAVEARAERYREAGWAEVVVLGRGEPFHRWEHERWCKDKGGRIYIALGHRGEVSFHEGYVTCKEARKLERGEVIERPVRPEVSSTTQAYIDLHRHAAVRAKLANETGLALRVMVAHAIAGSPLWSVHIEAQRAPNEAVAESVETSASEALFDARRRMVLGLLGLDPDSPTVAGSGQDIACLLLRLMRLADHEVMAVLGVVMGETLAVGSGLVELLGQHLSIDMASVWQADDALLDSIRDRGVMGHILAEVAGEIVAVENAKATTKVQRGIVRDCLIGSNGRAKREGWVPRWMTFPPSAYTPRGGVGSVERAERIAASRAPEADAEDSSDAADANASDTDEGLPWAA